MGALTAPSGLQKESLPFDQGLPSLPLLFQEEWVWETYRRRFGDSEEPPERLRLRQFLYRPGAWALAGYGQERRLGDLLVEDQFGVELTAGSPERLFRYPDDPYLPGLPRAAVASEAHDLVMEHVGLHPYRLDVKAVRYMVGSHAVLKHTVVWRHGEKATLFVRVVPPDHLPRFLAAAELVKSSGFLLPWLAGSWPEGGVAWVAGVPGQTLRALIAKGRAPEPALVLDGISPLWSEPAPPQVGYIFDVAKGLRWTQHLLSRSLQEEAARELVDRVTSALDPFAEGWRPSGLAHNDFHDAQLVLTPSGRLALVDYEETGLGDPLLDIGNFLAHLHWIAHFGGSARSAAYREELRAAAVARFGWDEAALALREAFALFRLSTNPVRDLRPGWPAEVEKGLRLVLETLDESHALR